MYRTSIIVVLSSLMLVACKGKPPVAAPDGHLSTFPTVDPNANRDDAVQRLVENFSRVHFALDSASLDAQAQRLLAENAAILQKYTDIRIEIQGHADERGTTDYNVALGMRRAGSVRDALTRLGVAPSRVTTISFGEERPLASGSGEVAWAQNRRAEFRVLTPSAPVQGTTGG